MEEKTLSVLKQNEWKNNSVFMIDQTKIANELVYVILWQKETTYCKPIQSKSKRSVNPNLLTHLANLNVNHARIRIVAEHTIARIKKLNNA